MSTIKVTNLQHASAASPAIVLASDSTATLNGLAYPTSGSLSGRNRIINGDMRIDQRNAGASVTSAGPIYTVDRWSWYYTSGSGHTIQQNTDAPAGFSNSLKVTVGTGASPSASHQNILWQPIEGYNAADLGFGAAGASTITFSFWVKSSLTGTFNVWFQNSANNRAYVSTYTISVANTWEQKSITIAGDTTGTWLKTNGTGLFVGWSLGCGSNFNTTANTWTSGDLKSTSGATSVVATNGATFYITGVQLEAGSVATPFERRSYGQELALCQRYYCKSYNQADVPGTVTRTGGIQLGSYSNSATGMNNGVGFRFPVVMRASPAVTGYDPDAANTTGQGRWDAAGVGATQGALTFGVIGDAGVGAVTIATTGRTAGAGLTVLFHYTAAIEL